MSVKTASLVAALAALTTTSAALADFSGYYDPANWTLTELGTGTGTVDTSGAPASIVLIGGDSGDDTDTYFTINAPSAGTVSFDWLYESEDDPGFDAGYYVVTDLGNFTMLSTTNGESGHIDLPVSSGELFGFNIFSTDGTFGAGIMTISNFSAPAVPEPATLGALAALSVLALRRRG